MPLLTVPFSYTTILPSNNRKILNDASKATVFHNFQLAKYANVANVGKELRAPEIRAPGVRSTRRNQFCLMDQRI
jgi:hypothetical protein